MLLFMDSNYGVVVYQPERTDCTKCSSPLDSVEVARNLLSGDEDCRKFTTVSSTGFKPWYDSIRLIPLSFKFHPPNLLARLDSVQKSNLSADDKAQCLPLTNCDLLEFSPVYSRKSFLRTQVGKCSPLNSQDHCAEDHKSEDCNLLPASDRQGDDDNRRSMTQEEMLNALAKPLWCASPYLSNKSRKQEDLVLKKFKGAILHEMKKKHSLNYHQRGKWIIRRNKDLTKGKNSTVEQLWKKVCALIKEGRLPHCNAKFQKMQDEFWVYCDFQHSLEVRSTLEKVLGNIGDMQFLVHPVGVVMEL